MTPITRRQQTLCYNDDEPDKAISRAWKLCTAWPCKIPPMSSRLQWRSRAYEDSSSLKNINLTPVKLISRQGGLILSQVKSTSLYGNISLARSINESVWQYQFDVRRWQQTMGYNDDEPNKAIWILR
jgi:hypothetical protein